MSFVAEFNTLPRESLLERCQQTTVAAAQESLRRSTLSLTDFAHVISPAAGELVEVRFQKKLTLVFGPKS